MLVDGNIFEDEMSGYFNESSEINPSASFPTQVTPYISLVSVGRQGSDVPVNIAKEEAQSKITSIAQDYNLVLYNTSFFLEAHELSLLAEKTQGIIMVARIKQTPLSSLTEAIERINNFNLNFLGFVVVE